MLVIYTFLLGDNGSKKNKSVRAEKTMASGRCNSVSCGSCCECTNITIRAVKPPPPPIGVTMTFINPNTISVPAMFPVPWTQSLTALSIGTPFEISNSDATVLICKLGGIYDIHWNIQLQHPTDPIATTFNVTGMILDVTTFTAITTAVVSQLFPTVTADDNFTVVGFARIRLAANARISLTLATNVAGLTTIPVVGTGQPAVSAMIVLTRAGL